MRKENVITLISQQTEINKEAVSEIIDNFFLLVEGPMTEGNNIYLRGFGTFVNREKALRVDRNISMSKSLIIEEYFAPKFKPSHKFIDIVI